jgi:hypothetical protein
MMNAEKAANHVAFIDDYLAKRNIFASGCKKFFPKELPVQRLVRHKSVLVRYTEPVLAMSVSKFPMSFIAGFTPDLDYWTDGVIIISIQKKIQVSEVWVNLDRSSLEHLMRTGEPVHTAAILFNEDLNYLPVALLATETCWRAFLPVYIDFALHKFRGLKLGGHRVWLSADKSGCIFTGRGQLPAYIAELKLSDTVITQVDSLWRHLNENCRYRS